FGMAFFDIKAIRKQQFISFTPISEQVKILEEVRVMFKYFVIIGGIEFGMVAAAIQGKVDCVDYISHLICPGASGVASRRLVHPMVITRIFRSRGGQTIPLLPSGPCRKE